jgi:hypothetical protein
VTGWSEAFLGIIAVATLAIAIVQVGVIVAAGRLARRVEALADQFEREMRPLFGHLNAIGRDAARAAALATAQVERADQVFSEFSVRMDQVLSNIQASFGGPVREGRALISAFLAAIRAIRELRRNAAARQARSEDEDALFI